ncbi:unnamed protein product [Brassicogethes aeneus]|uniref:Uncharacterized protein n=1 Tax=Brassicogethes aeneus TaxID=1431903 RepID=A0A9P0B9N4_BRAAE|nr:unnamed protein product [Brassicogethes aeneus]
MPDEKSTPVSNCKYCKNNVANAIAKCEICESVYHTSCALRIPGLVAVGKNNLVKCCVKVSEVKSPLVENDLDIIKEIIRAKEEIIKSKDEIITEIKAKELLLYQNIKLLEEKVAQRGQKLGNTAGPIMQHVKQVDQPTNNTTIDNQSKTAVITKTKQNVSNKEMNLGVLQAQTASKMKEIINLGTPDSDHNPESRQPAKTDNGADWKLVKHKRRYLVGKSDLSAGVTTVPKLTSLHVTRLAPGTQAETLKEFLKQKFPDVQCEEHSSKHPESYASMKVTIRQEQLKDAWKRESWPNGAFVSRFFHKKRMVSAQADPTKEA